MSAKITAPSMAKRRIGCSVISTAISGCRTPPPGSHGVVAAPGTRAANGPPDASPTPGCGRTILAAGRRPGEGSRSRLDGGGKDVPGPVDRGGVGVVQEPRLEWRRRQRRARLGRRRRRRQRTVPGRPWRRRPTIDARSGPGKKLSIAPTRCTHPGDADLLQERCGAVPRGWRPSASSRSYSPGSAVMRRSVARPAAVTTGLPASVPAWYTGPSGAMRRISPAGPRRRPRGAAADDLAEGW